MQQLSMRIQDRYFEVQLNLTDHAVVLILLVY